MATKHPRKIVNFKEKNSFKNEFPLVVGLFKNKIELTSQEVSSFHHLNNTFLVYVKHYGGEFLAREYLIKGDENMSIIDYVYMVPNDKIESIIEEFNNLLLDYEILKNLVRFE